MASGPNIPTPNFNWVPFYEAFAQRLFTYKDNRPELLRKIYGAADTAEAEALIETFHDKTPTGEKVPFEDIDPFSVFSIFNRRNVDKATISGKETAALKNRRLAVKLLNQAIDVPSPMPEDIHFSGIPLTFALRSWFIPFMFEREENDIQSHWNLLKAANELANAKHPTVAQKEAFSTLFDLSQAVKYVASPKLSIGLYWAFPTYFSPIDKFTRQYALEILNIKIPDKFSGDFYLKILEEFHKHMSSGAGKRFSSVHDLAWKAWVYDEFERQEDNGGTENDDEENGDLPPPPIEEYSINDVVKEGCFIPKGKIQDILESWELKRNLILQGPPGTGKTWLARRLAYALIGNTDETKVNSVQFHPNMSYEDFVRGYRPNPDGKLEAVNGIFMEAAEKAAADPKSKYAIVIEEINRGNPAMIFGELLTLMEADKRSEDNAIDLTYPDDTGNKSFFIPPNLYIIGTMNIADRSLAMVDLALRRRFAFYDLKPELGRTWLQWVKDHGVSNEIAEGILERMQGLNQAIAQSPALGEQYQIGHSSVTPATAFDNDADTRHWFKQVAETEIYPLLQEYWFDSPQELDEAWDDFTAPSDPAFPNGVLG